METLRLVPRYTCFSVDKEVLALSYILGRGFGSKIVDCRDSDSYLTFTAYDYDLSKQEIVPILKFDMSKLSITKLEDHNFKILYDNKPLFVGIKAFCALANKGKDFARNRYIKVKNPLASRRHWDAFCKINSETCYEIHSSAFFADPMKVLLECDERLPQKELIYFEDCVIFFDKVITKASGHYYFTDCKAVQFKVFT